MAADMFDVRRIERMLKMGAVPPTGEVSRVIPLCRYLRPPEEYALPLGRSDREPKEGEEQS